MHINVLELAAACLALTKLAAAAQGTHIHLKTDNLAAIAYINKMGGTHSPECNHVSQQIWEWAVAREEIWLSAAYIPGDANVVADFHSCCFHENKEWALAHFSHRQMQNCHSIFPGCRTRMLMRWMPLLSPGRI